MKLIIIEKGVIYKVKEKRWLISFFQNSFFEMTFAFSKDLERKKVKK